MWPASYFAPTYFPTRYFPKVGEDAEPPPVAAAEPGVGAYHVDPIVPWKGWPALPPVPVKPAPPPPDPRMKDPQHRERMKNLAKANAAREANKQAAANAESERMNALKLAQAEQRDQQKKAHLEDRMLTIAARQELMKRAKKRWMRGN